MPLMPPFLEEAAPPPPPPPPPSPPPRAGLAPGGVWYDGPTATPERQARREREGSVGGAWGERGRRVEPSIAGVEESSATSSATHYSDGRRAARRPCWRSRATLHASGARVDLPSGQPSLEPRRADELTHLQPLACAGRLAPGISVLGTLWRARALEPTFPARRRCSSARRRLCRPGRSSLPPQVCRRKLRHDGGRQRVNAVGSTRGWARRCCQAGGTGRAAAATSRSGCEQRGGHTWFVRILIQLHPRVLRLLAAVLLVGAVRGDEAEDQHRVDQQVQKPMHARPAALHAAGTLV